MRVWSRLLVVLAFVLAAPGCGRSERASSGKWDHVKTVPVVAPFDRLDVPLSGGQVFACSAEEDTGSRHPIPAVCSIAHRRTDGDAALERYHAHLTRLGFRRTEVHGNMYIYQGPKFELSLDAIQPDDVATVTIAIGTPKL